MNSQVVSTIIIPTASLCVAALAVVLAQRRIKRLSASSVGLRHELRDTGTKRELWVIVHVVDDHPVHDVVVDMIHGTYREKVASASVISRDTPLERMVQAQSLDSPGAGDIRFEVLFTDINIRRWKRESSGRVTRVRSSRRAR